MAAEKTRNPAWNRLETDLYNEGIDIEGATIRECLSQMQHEDYLRTSDIDLLKVLLLELVRMRTSDITHEVEQALQRASTRSQP